MRFADTPDVRGLADLVRARVGRPGAAAFLDRLRRGPDWLPALPRAERRIFCVLLGELLRVGERSLGLDACVPRDFTN